MSDNRTVLRPKQPRFRVNDTVYARISATKGFIEPLFVHAINYNPAHNSWIYTFRRTKSIANFGQPPQLIPARLFEHQIADLCEALQLQISTFKREHDAAVRTFQERCGATSSEVVIKPPVVTLTDNKNITQPPRPRFGFNSVVYLTETANVVGRIEAFRVDGMSWDTTKNQWMYRIDFQPRPEHHMTLGDADNRRRPYTVLYAESELSTFCEAQSLVVQFWVSALSKAQSRLSTYCHGSD